MNDVDTPLQWADVLQTLERPRKVRGEPDENRHAYLQMKIGIGLSRRAGGRYPSRQQLAWRASWAARRPSLVVVDLDRWPVDRQS